MRMMIRVTLPHESANPRLLDGSFAKVLQSYMEDIKPEAAYFVAENGVRTAYFFVHMTDSSQLPAIGEPPYIAYHAKVDVTPAMNMDDLKAAMPAIEAAIKKYAK